MAGINRLSYVPGAILKKPIALKKAPAPKPGGKAPTGLVTQSAQKLVDHKDAIDRFVDRAIFG